MDGDELRVSQPEDPHDRTPAVAEPVRWTRILALQAAIKEGSYRISAEEVADSLLRFAEHHGPSELPMYSA